MNNDIMSSQHITIDFDLLDFKNNAEDIRCKDNDIKSTSISVKCLFKGELIDLTDMDIFIRLQSKMNVIEDTIVDIDLSNSTINYTLPSNSLLHGINHFEIVLMKDEEWIKISPKVYYKVYSSVPDDGVTGSDQYPILVELIKDVRFLINKVEVLDETVTNSEIIRNNNESNREQNESVRISSEITRNNEESIRVSNEDNRKYEELIRVSSENDRIDNELIRISSESDRINNELIRVSSEDNRDNEESIRVSSENDRILNENNRVDNETNRVESFSTLESSMIEVISDANDKIIDFEGRMNDIEDEFNEIKSGNVFATLIYVDELIGKLNDKITELTYEISNIRMQFNIPSSNMTLDGDVYRFTVNHNLNIDTFLDIEVKNYKSINVEYDYSIIDANSIDIIVQNDEDLIVVLKYHKN